LTPHVKQGTKANVFINVMVINRQFLLNLVEDTVTHGFTSFESDILVQIRVHLLIEIYWN